LIPRCYGLYESKYSLALLLEYSGDPIQDFEKIPLEGRYVVVNSVLQWLCSLDV